MPQRGVIGGGLANGFDEFMAPISGQQCSRQRQKLSTEAVGEQAEVADAHEAFWQHVKEEAAQELRSLESHGTLPAAMGIVLPSEGDLLAVESDQAVVGDGDAVGVTAEIAQHLRGSAHGLLGIDHPVLSMDSAQQLRELFRMLKACSRTPAVEQPLAIEVLQSGGKLAAKHLVQDMDGKQEAMARSDPSPVIG